MWLVFGGVLVLLVCFCCCLVVFFVVGGVVVFLFVVGVGGCWFVWSGVVFFDCFVGLVVLGVDFGGVGDEFVFGGGVV
ncbi:hypothetical protein ACQ9A5_25205, partial [Escherichia coli]|uniref:hypothetical protein n=1 Tax=Escherichia coli TaxID=562 RepID=UPI003D365D2A